MYVFKSLFPVQWCQYQIQEVLKKWVSGAKFLCKKILRKDYVKKKLPLHGKIVNMVLKKSKHISNIKITMWIFLFVSIK